ncbi:MAG TPA: YbaK/EbsC family protein [Dehalococcoidia bacterium]|nr:YbaK/EbsC family protein [Dehalococcoidia bacterium]
MGSLMNLAAFLVNSKVEFEFMEKRATHHATEAAAASGLSLGEIVKSIVFTDQDGRPMLAVVLANTDVSRHKLERCSGSKSVRLASDVIAKAATGYPTGGIPPVGHRRKLPVYIDKRVMRCDCVWCGGGARSKLVKLKTSDISRLAAANICDLATD